MDEGHAPESTLMITPSEVMEYLFCPRFIYFINCLNIPQHEELRYKVLKGRELHERKASENKDYIRKRIGCIGKDILVYVASPIIRVRGVIDEVLFFSDGSAGPLDYKYTEYHDFLFSTHRVQSILYAMLIKEVYQRPVYRGYICYTRHGAELKEIMYKPEDFQYTREVVAEIFEIITKGYYPKRSNSIIRCVDCCYKNICV